MCGKFRQSLKHTVSSLKKFTGIIDGHQCGLIPLEIGVY
jgi:hypothetical protein